MPGTVVGVASERDVLVLEASGPFPNLLELLDAHRVSGKQLHQTDDRLSLIVSRENLHEEARVRQAIASDFGDRVHIVDDLGAVSVVGAGINASFANLRRGSDALKHEGMTPGGVATSSFRITWLLQRHRLDEAVRLLHQLFIDKDAI
jgi:aspartate kinase